MISLNCEECGRLLAEFEALPDQKFRTITHGISIAMPLNAKSGDAYADCPECNHSTRFDARYLARPYPKDEEDDD